MEVNINADESLSVALKVYWKRKSKNLYFLCFPSLL